MNKLVYPVSLAARAGGLRIDVEAAEPDVRPLGVAESTLRRVRVKGTLAAVDEEFIFRGVLDGDYEQPCDRCLEPAARSVEQEVVWLFTPGHEPAAIANDESEDEAVDVELDSERVRYFENEEIDLRQSVWEELLLAAPVKYYCREECKGLCPTCGANLNEGACACAGNEEVNHSGLAALKEMFPNLPSQASEEKTRARTKETNR